MGSRDFGDGLRCAAAGAWLEIEPKSGSLEGGHPTSIAVYASSFAARTSMRRGFLCIRSAIAAEPLVAVPVALTVQGPVAAELERERKG